MVDLSLCSPRQQQRGRRVEQQSSDRAKGYIQVYTGHGKGKTTAALGLAIRAAGAGHKIFMAQFIKSQVCCEHEALKKFQDLISFRLYGEGFLKGKPGESDKEAAQKGFKEVREIINSGEYDLVILDEINVAIHHDLLKVEEVLDLLNERPPFVEIVLTGRYAASEILERADLVTEMKEIKHYKHTGVQARVGIEK